MANVINRTTKQYLQNVHTPAFPYAQWIKNPVLPTCASKYWKIVGDQVLEMNQPEKDAIIAAETASLRYKPKSKNQIIAELWLVIAPTVPKDGYTIPGVPGMPPPRDQDIVVPPVLPDSPEVKAEKDARAQRFNTALQANQFFSLRLDSNSYNLARAEAQKLLLANIITQDDYDLLDSILPLEH